MADPEEKELVRIKSRYGVSMLGVQMFIDNRAWTVVALAKQEFRDSWCWQWWIVMPEKNAF